MHKYSLERKRLPPEPLTIATEIYVEKRTLLLLGNIAKNQYAQAEHKMLQGGTAPLVVRREPSDFLFDQKRLIERYASSSERQKALDTENDDPSHNQLIERLVAKHLKDFKHPIGAVVMDESTWDEWDDLKFFFLTDALSVDRWVVRKSGTVEYVG